MTSVFIINGFLDSGKTDFINYTITQPYFQSRQTTLLIVCEEGEKEYEPKVLERTRTVMEVIDDEDDFTAKKLSELEKKYKPGRIVIEFNGMWILKNHKLPWGWKIEQQITMINGATFESYFTNMKSLLAEQIRGSELIIMNRCDGLDEKIASYKRNIKALNQQADIIFENKDGEMNVTLEEDLPYDLTKDPIVLDDTGYGIWYLDALDNMDRYNGKTVSFLAQVVKPDTMEKGYLVPGRSAMTCCADDIAFLGFICKTDESDKYSKGDWIKVTAELKVEFWKDYNGVGPVLYAKNIEKAKAPKEEIINLV